MQVKEITDSYVGKMLSSIRTALTLLERVKPAAANAEVDRAKREEVIKRAVATSWGSNEEQAADMVVEGIDKSGCKNGKNEEKEKETSRNGLARTASITSVDSQASQESQRFEVQAMQEYVYTADRENWWLCVYTAGIAYNIGW